MNGATPDMETRPNASKAAATATALTGSGRAIYQRKAVFRARVGTACIAKPRTKRAATSGLILAGGTDTFKSPRNQSPAAERDGARNTTQLRVVNEKVARTCRTAFQGTGLRLVPYSKLV